MYEIVKETKEPGFPCVLILCPVLLEVSVVAITTVITTVVATNAESFCVWVAGWRVSRVAWMDTVEVDSPTTPALQTRKLSHRKFEGTVSGHAGEIRSWWASTLELVVL